MPYNEDLHYEDYLQLDKITSAQQLESEKFGEPAHSEMLFIIIHQAYELWFKQIIHEMSSVIDIFDQDFVTEANVGKAVGRLRRVVAIQKVLLEQVNVLETMTPLAFLDFRKYLGTASGFQSFQFRIVENRLGLKREDRPTYVSGREYIDEFSGAKREALEESERQPTLREVVEKWLERTPFVNLDSFNFIDSYAQAVRNMLDDERKMISSDPRMSESEISEALKQVDITLDDFEKFLNASTHEEMLKERKLFFSHKALISALFISVYRNEPVLHMPFRLLQTLIDIDENFTSWRDRHAILVHRMLGKKMGSGRSSGYEFLRGSIEKYRIFTDLFSLSTYLIPRSQVPELPEDVRKELSFHYSVEASG